MRDIMKRVSLMLAILLAVCTVSIADCIIPTTESDATEVIAAEQEQPLASPEAEVPPTNDAAAEEQTDSNAGAAEEVHEAEAEVNSEPAAEEPAPEKKEEPVEEKKEEPVEEKKEEPAQEKAEEAGSKGGESPAREEKEEPGTSEEEREPETDISEEPEYKAEADETVTESGTETPDTGADPVPEEEAAEENLIDIIEEGGKRVYIFCSRSPVMKKGDLVELTSRLEGFDGCEVHYQWECDKHDGQGFQGVENATEDSYAFEASVETLSWDWKLTVSYQ